MPSNPHFRHHSRGVLVPIISTAQSAKSVVLLDFARITDRSGLDPLLQGAEQWAKDTGNEVRTSFHSGDVPSHQEAFRAAITAHAKGIVTSTPDPGSLIKVTAEAHAAGIPVIIINTDDKASGRDAYVGGDNVAAGRRLAQYLVDHGFVKKGDFVWTPVEVPGATYQTLQTQGYDTVFKPLGISTEITEAKLDQAEVISRMSDYLTANRSKIKAIYCIGDLVSGSIKRVFDQDWDQARRDTGRRLGQFDRHCSGSDRWVRECGHVAGSAGHELYGVIDGGDGGGRDSSRLRYHCRHSLRKGEGSNLPEGHAGRRGEVDGRFAKRENSEECGGDRQERAS